MAQEAITQSTQLNRALFPGVTQKPARAVSFLNEKRAEQVIRTYLSVYLKRPRCPRCVGLADHAFTTWHREAKIRGIVLGPAYSILCDGKYFKSIDQQYRRRNGWARLTYRRALGLWSKFVEPLCAARGDCACGRRLKMAEYKRPLCTGAKE